MKDIIPPGYRDFDADETRKPAENPLFVLHRLLRGRYKYAAVFGALLAVPLAIGAYLAVPPVYMSTGIVRIAPTITVTLFKTPDSDVPPLFESMVATQATTLGSRRVMDMALTDDLLRYSGWPAAPEGLVLLKKNLEVSNRGALELIRVTVKSKKPELAQKAVNAVLNSYETVYDEGSANSFTKKQKTIQAYKDGLDLQLQSLNSQLAQFSKKYATDDLEELHAERIKRISDLDRNIQSLELNIAARKNESPDGAKPEGVEVPLPGLALSDPTLQRLVDDRRAVEKAIDELSRTVGPEHREMVLLKNKLVAANNKVAEREKEVRDLMKAAGPANNAAAMSVEQITTALERLKTMRGTELTAANDLEATKLAISGIKDRIEDAKREAEEANRTLSKINFESSSLQVGRMSVVQRGDFPVEPTTDRRLPLAVFGALAGAGLGVGGVLLFGLLRGGMRYIDDIEHSDTAPLLGTVPDLADGVVEQEQMAALSIHHLRNTLQLQHSKVKGGKVFTITSAASGDGKTSLAIALAMSFAASGRRTVIVDTDLVGRGLTRQLDLVGKPGLCQALQSAHLSGEVHETKVNSLWAVPSGELNGFVAEHLSSEPMERIIDQLREQFDTIIMDTGPILGSLEANVVAPVSDGVVLVVSRGQGAKVVRASIQRLRRLGAACSGMIFNRATTRDFERSVSTASVSARSLQASQQVNRDAKNSGRTILLQALGTSGRVTDTANGKVD